MSNVPFKERVAQVAIIHAPLYKQVFVDYEYLFCSDAFKNRPFYILACREDNYRHLIGVNTSMSASAFFAACMDGSLTANDFDFIKKHRSEKEVKGSVRKKIQVLPLFVSMIGQNLVAQEDFSKNNVSCAFATTDCKFTVGFVECGKSRPMTLLNGNELDWNKSEMIDLVLRRPAGAEKFDTLISGNNQLLQKYMASISDLVADNLIDH